MILLLHAIFLVPVVNAWTFRYTNGTGATEIDRGDEAQNCTTSPIGKEKLFTWDPEGSDLCVSIYRDIDCDSRAGYSCTAWRKNASEAFSAYDVLLETEIEAKHETSTLAVSTSTSTSSLTSSSTSTSTLTSTSTSSSSSVSSASASTTPTESIVSASSSNSGSSSSPSLSGGAIAGVVIGVVAGVAIVVAFIVVFMKKRNKKNAVVDNQPGGYGPHEADATGSSVSGTTVVEKGGESAVRPFSPRSARVVELAGDEGSAELGSSPIIVAWVEMYLIQLLR
ncbi:unnamed protein product [Penicillium glandicola]